MLEWMVETFQRRYCILPIYAISHSWEFLPFIARPRRQYFDLIIYVSWSISMVKHKFVSNILEKIAFISVWRHPQVTKLKNCEIQKFDNTSWQIEDHDWTRTYIALSIYCPKIKFLQWIIGSIDQKRLLVFQERVTVSN